MENRLGSVRFAAIELVAPAKFTSLVGVLERLCTQRDKRPGVR